MFRLFALCAAALLTTHASSAYAQVAKVNVSGKLSGGNFVNAVCTVDANGQITGTGVLYGVNPSTGYTYKYPFTVSKGSTATGKLILTGKMTAGPDVVLSATVPSGEMIFTYVVNGKSYTLTGTGSVTIVK